MSEIKVNKISPRTNCGTTTLGDSGDTISIPAGVTISNSGTAAGFGGTGEISWDTTIKTTGTFTATAGVGYFLNTTGGTITVNLPAGAAGSSVALADYAGTWQTNKVTVSPNGSEKIGGVATDIFLTTEGQSVTFVYIDGTQGWVNVLDSTSNVRGNAYITATGGTITTSGNDKIHTFTGPGTFTVSGAAICATDNLVSYVVVAGGGGGGTSGGGGGGAGGFREVKSPSSPYTASPLDGYPSAPNRVTVSATAYPITVGAGGGVSASPPSAGSVGIVGANSVFSTVTSAGGGYGGARSASIGPVTNGGNGGSGGGGSWDIPGTGSFSVGGSGNTPPTTPAQGNNGSRGNHNGPTHSVTGGGGGAGGAAPTSGPGGGGPAGYGTGNGGNGISTEITGSAVVRGGGGGGCTSYGGNGGPGGGGGGGATPTIAGTVNTGGGGGGGGFAGPPNPSAGAGGSGIVIIRYKYQ